MSHRDGLHCPYGRPRVGLHGVGDSKDSVRVNRGYDLPHAGSTAPVGSDASAVCLASSQDWARVIIVS